MDENTLQLCRSTERIAALGELEFRRGEFETAREHFLAALALARNPMERRFLSQRISACEHSNEPITR